MSYEYKVGGKTVKLEVDEDLVALRFREPAEQSVRASTVARPEMGNFEDRFEVPGEKLTVFKIAPAPLALGIRHANAMSAMATDAQVDRATPVFKVGNNHVVATDRLLVGFIEGSEAAKVLEDLGCEVIEQIDNEFLVGIDPTADPFEVIAKLDELPVVDYAEPDFATFGSHIAQPAGPEAAPRDQTDPLAPNQYAIKITKADEAWKLQTGDGEIKIAILDEGVDTRHEDLECAIVGSFDAMDGDANQQPNPWDAHGTACAGLAAGIHNNGLGIKGIGGGCSLLAVRIARSPYKGGNWSSTTSGIKSAIEWSWRNGADVLSNSWGGGSPSSAITNAFTRARTRGRDGKGCVIVIAAGNANTLHDYPSNLDDVLSISASNEFDEPKTPTSQDGENWWGSNFGPKIDVAAPGVHNTTTDISGTAGYNQAPAPAGHYTPDFNGTSSSTPIVAGAVGLVLSANPDLEEAEVRDIIRDTADKVGSLPYVDGRNDRMGCGRLNVLGAVQSALAK